MRATVITDASFYAPPRRGGKQAETGVGGWAAWVRVDGFSNPIKGHGVIKAKDLRSSTEAELYAALNGIWLAAKHGGRKILLRTDCMAVIHLTKGLSNSARLNQIWHTALDEHDLRELAIDTAHVKGHGPIFDAASWVNDWCDQKSKLAMRKARRGEVCQTVLTR